MKQYLGKWQLIPELSHYEIGQTPESGSYLIEEKDGEIKFTIEWTASAKNQSVSFAAPSNGKQIASDFPGVDSFSVLHEDDFTLSGDAIAGEIQISRAMRRVSKDGKLMSILQENSDGKNSIIRIFQIYQRVSG